MLMHLAGERILTDLCGGFREKHGGNRYTFGRFCYLDACGDIRPEKVVFGKIRCVLCKQVRTQIKGPGDLIVLQLLADQSLGDGFTARFI